MKRDLNRLADESFDLVVVGGGVFGAFSAWDAAQRGLKVALIDRGDFGGATSAYSFKMVHGGIRYLQHADLYRVRQSSNERRAFLRIAPHLVHPLPIVVPTYGKGLSGKSILAAGMATYDALTFDRNRGISDPARRIPNGRIVSRAETLHLVPKLPTAGLTGAAVFCDGQMHNPPRLVLAVVQSADESGAAVANYVEAHGFLRSGDRIAGVRARDVASGATFDIRAGHTLNAAGPFAETVLDDVLGLKLSPPGSYSRDLCLIVPRRVLGGDHALAVKATSADPDAWVSRGARHLFLAPWRGYTLVGVWHRVHEGHPDAFTTNADEIQSYLDEINQAYPAGGLTVDDVSQWNAGLVPFGDNARGARDLRYGHRSRLVDHAATHGIEGLTTLIGVRFTTGRLEAAKAVDLIAARLGRAVSTCKTAQTPIHGGALGDYECFLKSAVTRHAEDLPEEVVSSLVRNHGTKWDDVLRHADQDRSLFRTLGATSTIGAQVIHAVRAEMALTLTDVVTRRTDMGSAAHPGKDAVRACGEIMAKELGWATDKLEAEWRRTEAHFARHTPNGPAG